MFQPSAFTTLGWGTSTKAKTADFAFWSVQGAVDGTYVTTDPSITIGVGKTDVTATAWYLESGAEGPAMVLIDAFDVEIGDFIDDDFVSVVSDASLTAAANSNGEVPTTNAVDVRAASAVRGMPFMRWEVVSGQEVVVAEDLDLTAAKSAVALAFFGSIPVRVPVRHYELGTWVSWPVTVDAGGPTGNGPVPPWTPFIARLAEALLLADAATAVSAEAGGPALRGAAEEIAHLGELIAKEIVAEARD